MSNNINNTTNNSSVPNKDKLDLFLNKVWLLKNQFNDDSLYEKFLIALESKLNTLWNKYKSNDSITKMISYLKNSVSKIKEALVANKDIDNFFCDLTESCDKNTNTNTNTT